MKSRDTLNLKIESQYHNSVKNYLIGFLLSIILTVIPFWIVMTRILPYHSTLFIIVTCAVVQIIVHLVFFLHLNSSAKEEVRWNLLALIFSILIIALLVIGSLWIMWNLNYMMSNG
ncbi:MAG: cytochrome o ubiquinol oxidase subunit IV [Candidatus Dasytiphilus stammeri]